MYVLLGILWLEDDDSPVLDNKSDFSKEWPSPSSPFAATVVCCLRLFGLLVLNNWNAIPPRPVPLSCKSQIQGWNAKSSSRRSPFCGFEGDFKVHGFFYQRDWGIPLLTNGQTNYYQRHLAFHLYAFHQSVVNLGWLVILVLKNLIKRPNINISITLILIKSTV